MHMNIPEEPPPRLRDIANPWVRRPLALLGGATALLIFPAWEGLKAFKTHACEICGDIADAWRGVGSKP